MTPQLDKHMKQHLSQYDFIIEEMSEITLIAGGTERYSLYVALSRKSGLITSEDCYAFSKRMLLHGYLCFWDETFDNIVTTSGEPVSDWVPSEKKGVVLLEAHALTDVFQSLDAFIDRLQALPLFRGSDLVADFQERATYLRNRAMPHDTLPSHAAFLRQLKKDANALEQFELVCEFRCDEATNYPEYVALLETVFADRVIMPPYYRLHPDVALK